MRIGVDFGTSFCSAAVLVNGSLQHIWFGQSQQFRTAVFFPDRFVPDSDFSLTARDEQEIESAVRAQHSRFSEENAVYETRLAEQVREEKYQNIVSVEQKNSRRALLVKPKRISDEEVRQRTYSAIKRRWRELQEQVTSQEGLNLRQANGVFGEEAIDALYNQEKGRIFQSPKSMLGFNLDRAHQDVIVGVIGQVLKHIRRVASRQLGVEITAVTLGRPVEFRGLQGSHDDQAVQQLLERAATEAGFIDVQFLNEPCAAAYGYHSTQAQRHAALVIDIGGGTTDAAYADVGGELPHPLIHQSWGWPHGGTDVDVELSVRAAMPLFGKDAPHGLPLHVYRSAAKVSNLVAQQEFTKRPLAGVSPHFVARLERLKSSGVTVKLNRDVERLKVELSDDISASVPLDYIERGLEVRAGRDDLEASINGFMMRFRAFLEQIKSQLPDADLAIFMAGGMSRAPYVQQCVREVFPQSRIVMGDASYGVVNGLAQAAEASSRSEQTAIGGQGATNMEAQKASFLAAMAQADRCARTYEQAVRVYRQQHDVQLAIFARTSLGSYLKLLHEQVSEAVGLNIHAGYLPDADQFTEEEYFQALIRRNRVGNGKNALARVPEFLREAFEDHDEESFRELASELREECRSAYGEMKEIRELIDDEPTGMDLLEALDSWLTEGSEGQRTIKEAKALSDNLYEGWMRCQKAGLDLLCMADEFGDDDPDRDLPIELLN